MDEGTRDRHARAAVRRDGASPENPATDSDATDSDATDSDATERESRFPIDLDLALENCLGDRGFLAEMLGKFLKQAAEMIAQLDRGIQEGELETVQGLAHQLKGTSGLLGCMDLYEGVVALHAMAVGSVKPATLLAMLADVTRQVEAVRECAGQLGLTDAE